MTKELTVKRIHEALEKHYRGSKFNGKLERELLITPIYNDHEKVGTIIFSLEGSPPKGYAMYIRESKILNLYDGCGRKLKRISDCVIKGDNYPDDFNLGEFRKANDKEEKIQENEDD